MNEQEHDHSPQPDREIAYSEGEVIAGTELVLPHISRRAITFSEARYRLADNREVPVLVKRFFPEVAQSSIFKERAMAEVALTLQLSQDQDLGDHFVKVYEVRTTPHIEIIFHFYEGRTLHHQLQEKPPSFSTFKSIVTRTSAALAHLHEHYGLVHRDVKSSNILISQGLSVLSDFGTTPEGGNNLVGTLSHLDPETLLSRENDVSPPFRDVYAFATMLYGMLANSNAKEPYGQIQKDFSARFEMLKNRASAQLLAEELQVPTKIDANGNYISPQEFKNNLYRKVVLDYVHGQRQYVPLTAENLSEQLDPDLIAIIEPLNDVLAKVFSPQGNEYYPTMRSLQQDLLKIMGV